MSVTTQPFSILMSPFPPDNDTLANITYIGVCISMGSLVLCLIIESLIWKSMTRTDTSFMCHISTVTVSFWMLLSALLVLYRTVIVFSRMSRTVMMTIAFTIGYGAPLIIAIVTVAATSGNGGHIQEENTCWLSWYKTKAIWAFVIPALLIVFINLLVLIMIVYKILRSRIGATIQRDEKHAIVMIARCVGILTPLSGLTWEFGIGTMTSSAFGIHVVFGILNLLQVPISPSYIFTVKRRKHRNLFIYIGRSTYAAAYDVHH